MNDQILSANIRYINKGWEDFQKARIQAKLRVEALKRDGFEPTESMLEALSALEEMEGRFKKMSKNVMELHPMWDYFFAHVKGVGETLAATLITEVGDISKFPTPSSLWAYMGLTSEYVEAKCANGHKMLMSSDKHKECPVFQWDEKKKENIPCGGEVEIVERVKGKAPKRKRGFHYLFNSRLKMTAWKISGQLIKQGDDFFKDIYYKEKEKQARQNPELSKLHIHNRAMRKMVKRFLCLFWEAWREVEGLEIRTPYVIEKLGHMGYVKWAEVAAILDEGRRVVRKTKETIDYSTGEITEEPMPIAAKPMDK